MNLEIELVDFYPEYSSKHATEGTVHIYIKNLELDIRGIHYIRKKNSAYVFLPIKRGWDQDEEKIIRYPIVSSTNQEFNRTIQTDVRLLMDEYFKTWVKPEWLPDSKKKARHLMMLRQGGKPNERKK